MQLSLFLYLESPKSYISEDAESPCPTDPNTMDVDVVGSLPTMVNQPCKSTEVINEHYIFVSLFTTCLKVNPLIFRKVFLVVLI